MISLKEYMNNTGVTKVEYIERWLENAWIPGVIRGNKVSDTLFPDSARRPYRSRWLKPGINADKLRVHIVKACLSRRHISKELCFASAREFEALVFELEQAGLISRSVEDGITYFDSTEKSEAYCGKPLAELRKFVLDMRETVSKASAKGAAEGAVTACLTMQMAG